MIDPLPIERAMWARYAQFQPTPQPEGYRVGNCTRTYLEYDGATGIYVERDPATGAIVGYGVIDDREPEMEAS